MKLIVGLGNPGRLYQGSRHNIGFMCISHLAKKLHIGMDKKQGQARTGSGKIDSEAVTLARPQTGMNISGQSVAQLVHKFKLKPGDLIVIHDDLDLPLGKIRIRLGSSSGGHNGVASIIQHIGSREFYRIRVGIGRPAGEDTAGNKDAVVIDHVLSGFSSDERQVMNQIITQVAEAVESLVTEGLTIAMNKYN